MRRCCRRRIFVDRIAPPINDHSDISVPRYTRGVIHPLAMRRSQILISLNFETIHDDRPHFPPSPRRIIYLRDRPFMPAAEAEKHGITDVIAIILDI